MRTKTRHALATSVTLTLMSVGVAACSDEGDVGASPEQVVSQFRDAVNGDDLARIEALLAPNVIHSELVEDSATGEREPWAPDIVGSEAVVDLYKVLGPAPKGATPISPQSSAVLNSPDTELTDESTVVQTETFTHPTGFFSRTIVETQVSETGLIEHLSLIHVEPPDEIDDPTVAEAADFLNAIYAAHGLPEPVGNPEAKAAFHLGNPPCQEPEEGMEGNDPDVLAAQLDVLASDESPVWLMAGQGLAEARSYCPARFWEYRDVIEAAIGNTDADRAFDWAAIPVS